MADEPVLKIRSPSTIMVSAPTRGGKSVLMYNILKHVSVMFDKPVAKIIYCYGVYQPLYDDMKRDVENLLLFEGVPGREELERWNPTTEHCVIVLDDLMAKCAMSQDICDLFTIYSHHLNFTVFLLVQNLFSGGKQFRTISLNVAQFIIFRNQRDQTQIRTFARQLYPQGVNFFMDAYKRAVSIPYGYLFIDLDPASDPLYRLRTNILPGEVMIVYAQCDSRF